jgi:predicted porin
MGSSGVFRLAVKQIVVLLAVSSLPATGVWAQSSVTLYGVLDAGLMFTNKSYDPATGQNGGKQFEMISSGLEPSVFGLTGQEDLGGGLKAKFKLESGISLANGGFDNTNGGLFGRQAWLSLDSNVLVVLGTQYSLSKRTSLYAQVGATENHGRSTLGLDVDGALQGAPGTTIGGGIGILHRF